MTVRGAKDGSIERVIEHQAQEAENNRQEAPPKSERQKRFDELIEKLPKLGTKDALEQMAKLDPVTWCMYNRRLAGQAMTFDMARFLTPESIQAERAKYISEREHAMYVKGLRKRHRPWQIAPLRDDHPDKSYKKGRQIGISELSQSEAVCFLDQHPNTNLIYCFPRHGQLETFAATRLNPMFNETPRMRAMLSGTNQMMLKRINQSHIILRSAWESALGEGVNADVIVLDEKDRMKPGVDVAFRESLSSSLYQWMREVSTPSLPNRGVDAHWLVSDQQRWMVKCNACGEKQHISSKNIVKMMDLPLDVKELPEGAYEYRCHKYNNHGKTGCKGTLDRVHGEWVATRPSMKQKRGYHMPQTIAEWISATEVMQKKITYKFHQLWLNYVMGETAEAEDMLLTERDFDMAEAGFDPVQRRSSKWNLISIGIDWGHKNWITVMGLNANGRQYILNARMFEDNRAKELESVRQIDAWIDQYAPDIIIADDGYGKDRNAYLLRRSLERNQGAFFACRYNRAEKGGATFTPRWAPASNQVLVDRTMALKNMCRMIKDREIGFPSFENAMIALIVKHLQALAPMMEEDEDTKEIVEVIQATGDDHLAHSTLYAALGMDYLRKSNHFNFDFV